ncbi:aminopeptidase O isoform X2 [Takifugu flavidus]|uniref:aminopeptidase O isoform X2 n=1 Tax=Takifugu flavidus TaxID=433684 RepID=UPI00254489E4|nr:aminopeptidase O isoform X2 [Takifugu flavidus]
MEPGKDLHPDTDDLPLRANTNHILVRHYVLNLAVHIDRQVISGSVVLFLEPCPADGTNSEEDDNEIVRPIQAGGRRDGSARPIQDPNLKRESERNFWKSVSHKNTLDKFQVSSGATLQSSPGWEHTSDEDFTLVLDCCDIDVFKVEEVDVSSLSSMPDLQSGSSSETSAVPSWSLKSAAFVQNVISMPSSQWKQKHQLYLLSSHAPGVQDGSSLHFYRDQWSVQVRKIGISSPLEFPRALRICYETKPLGGSVRWTKDQDNRVCVYTAGSPINNRALFPCQEPPVALSTWQATIRAPCDCLVLMSGEEETPPINDEDTRFLIWNYYVTMPMPASTFTLAVGHWQQVTAEIPLESGEGLGEGADWGKTAKLRAEPRHWTEAELVSGLECSTAKVATGSPVQDSSGAATICPAFTHSSLEDEGRSATDYLGMADEGIFCSHGDYPCRFTQWSARSQRAIPHRVFGPVSLLQKAQAVLKLLPGCLAAAYTVLGVHPFPRLDVLIVPAGFSSLGMASPHIIFLSQSVLNAGSSGSGENDLSLCGSRICHEIAHSWFGLVIGAKDWTEEWISEGFATYLEDIIWAEARKLSSEEAREDSDLKALLRWRRLSDELKNSEEELQILRPNMESTGQVTESGSSMVKHALNPDKAFMQVHYLKGYFLLRFLASRVGEQQFITFLRLFVKKYHGQLILSQDFLRTLLITFPEMERKGLTLSAIYADWLDRPGIPKSGCVSV